MKETTLSPTAEEILRDGITEYNKTASNISKFVLSHKEESFFVGLMKKYADSFSSASPYRMFEADELIKLLDHAFESGSLYEYEKHFGSVPPKMENKEQFLKRMRELTKSK